MGTTPFKFETKLIHGGEPEPRICGAVNMPIFQSSTFEYKEDVGYHQIRYIRLNNTPNHDVLHKKLAELEMAEDAIVAASGMGAITTTLLSILKPGDHLLAQDCLYGGTLDFVLQDLKTFGVFVDFIDGAKPETWEKKITPKTKAFYVETITNPLMQVIDLKKVIELSKAHQLISLIDNTFASPFNFRPSEIGFDISLHSCSKYLNGHSDLVAGAAIGKVDLVASIRKKLNILGATLDPHACFLLHRGMKTLALRMRYQNQSALEIAQFLESHNAIESVYYPGLGSNPSHVIASDLLDGYGGMVGFEVRGGVTAAEKFIKQLTIAAVAPSLGGPETLITRPATTSHAGISEEARKTAGISDSLIRLSVGLEATEDLIADFEQALSIF